MRRFLSLLFILAALFVFSYQWETWLGFFKPMKNSAMGGTYVTTAEGVEALLLNPALLEARGTFALDTNLSNNFTTVVPKLLELLKDPEAVSQLATDTEFLESVRGVHSYGANLYGGYAANVLGVNVGGLGAFQSEVFWNLSLTNLDRVELGAWMGYFGLFGASLNVTEDLKIGFSAGAGMAGTLIPATDTSYPAQVNVMDEDPLPSVLPDVSKLFSYVDTFFFIFNVGAVYRWNDLALGVAFHYSSNDLLRNASAQILSIGASYDFKILKLAFELEDLLNQEKSFYRKTNIGVESNFGFLKLYGGLHAGWLTGGLKLDIPFLNVGFNAHVIELSPRAGLMGEAKYTLTFSTKF